MFEIQTRKFGRIEIDEAKIIVMPDGMLGFEGQKRYVLIQDKGMEPFKLYQAVDNPDLAFFVIDPLLILEGYRVDRNRVIKAAAWGKGDKISYLAVATIPDEKPEQMTVNLMGPIAINSTRGESYQLILENSGYALKHPLFQG
ncbi:MAG: flagellar assembly protein FliW [Desulfobacterium sp.]|jgi:flagellar assembly factor FliW|nr:flagellar assembly protein FliW [Desulfobacterium sp.]